MIKKGSEVTYSHTGIVSMDCHDDYLDFEDKQSIFVTDWDDVKVISEPEESFGPGDHVIETVENAGRHKRREFLIFEDFYLTRHFDTDDNWEHIQWPHFNTRFTSRWCSKEK